MKTPNLGDAHCGEGALQSQQMLFWDSFWRAASCRFAISTSCSSKDAGQRRPTGSSGHGEGIDGSYLGPRLWVDLPHGFGCHCVSRRENDRCERDVPGQMCLPCAIFDGSWWLGVGDYQVQEQS